MIIAGLTPLEWEVTIIDENCINPHYDSILLPDLVGITAFTSQANRAYEVADYFRRLGVPVVMGGIHATMCQEEVLERVDSIVTGEAESVWQQVLEDVRDGCLKQLYNGGMSDIRNIPAARHDLLSEGYAVGTIQTTRGCPGNCSFCSVTAFNGARYRMRPIEEVINEFKMVQEKRVFVVDDNLVGTSPTHISRTKSLFRAMIQANIKKKWVAQVTINFSDDEELLELAAEAGCQGVLIGFESASNDGLREVNKKFGFLKDRDYQASVRRIQKHKILVMGSFIIGLDGDGPGIGKHIAKTARHYGVDNVNVLFMTPLPGTSLWNQMLAEKRITLDKFPEDWNYYTLNYPVAQYKQLSMFDSTNEMLSCDKTFYSRRQILRRLLGNLKGRRQPLICAAINLSYRKYYHLSCKSLEDFNLSMAERTFV
jgi:radical SAM superfamily enzyme YgiQ (UPF0313 family)